MSFYFPPKCHISLTFQRAVTLVSPTIPSNGYFSSSSRKRIKMQIFDCNWINTIWWIKQVCPSKSFRTVTGWVGVEGWWWDGGLFHKVYHCNTCTVTRELHYPCFSYMYILCILGCTWVDLVVVRWSHVDFSPVAPSRGDHRIPAILTHVFLTITHVSYIMINWKGRNPMDSILHIIQNTNINTSSN